MSCLWLITFLLASVSYALQCSVTVNNFVASYRFLNNVAVHIPEESLSKIDVNFFQIICPSGFDDVNQTHHQETELPLLCKEGKVYHAFEDNEYPPNLHINCKDRALSFFQAETPTCDFSNIAIGYEIDEQMIVHAESCFDLFEMKVKYLHFIARPMNSLISVENNVVNAADNMTIEFPEPENFEEPDELSERLNESYPDLNLSAFYSYFQLVSEKMFPIVRNSVDVFPFSMVNRAILLNELMENNWKKFELLLHERTLDNKEYDVYVGVSNKLNVPSNLKHVVDYHPKRLIYYPQRIPELLWSYLKSKNSSEPEELVVIGVNSIFLTTENAKDYRLCEDVCHQFKWLDPLEKLRKIISFGYIYCCNVNEELKSKLDGFPIVKRPVPTSTEVPVATTSAKLVTNEISKVGDSTATHVDEEYENEISTNDYGEDYE